MAASWLLLKEQFRAGEAGFLNELYAANEEKRLKAFGDRWSKDPRPFAREMLFAYIADGCDRPHHRALVKKLYKNAEDAGDDELIGRFMIAFDRLLHREIVPVAIYDWTTRTTRTEHQLKSSADTPRTRAEADALGRFSVKTRLYLARRAWRWFRRIGRTDRERYFRAMRSVLVQYQDEHLATAAQLLDSWGLMNALYHGSDVLVRSHRGIRLAYGRTLKELAPAPIYPEVWERPDALLDMIDEAGSRTVRSFAISLLQSKHPEALRSIPVARLLAWLRSSKDDLQLLAVELIERSPELDKLPIGDWLALLQIDNLLVLPKIVELFEKHVLPARLDLDQCVRLACAQTAPVAELGLRWLRERMQQNGDLRIALPLAEAKAPVVREQAVSWLVAELEKHPKSTPEDLREVIDSRYDDARAAALRVLERERFESSPVLWAALAESPYPEIREYLVKHLEKRIDRLTPESVEHVWATSLLAVHRGGRAKQRVLRQVSARLIAEPNRVRALAPLLRIMLRSVRVPERRAALAAIATAAFERTELRSELAAHFPELKLPAEDAVCR